MLKSDKIMQVNKPLKHLEVLRQCRICPRNCGADRFNGASGWCGSDAGFNISSICLHKGEEPAISGKHGICNIFFSRCNLACIYCQNHQISDRKGEVPEYKLSFSEVVKCIKSYLDKGCTIVGFVSPSHYVPHVKAIIDALRQDGRNPTFVYNTNAYDKAEEIKELESYIDVYLPDLKYLDEKHSRLYSGAKNYPEFAKAAIKEMYHQKGSTLQFDETGQATKGLIIRHLILPGLATNSKAILQWIAWELSPSVAISLMAQYYPAGKVLKHAVLGRAVNREEYKSVVNEMETLGFYKGWVQDLRSHEHYRPDFQSDHPFGEG
jgi:putative pyruvate formate lyase activating enzyme